MAGAWSTSARPASPSTPSHGAVRPAPALRAVRRPPHQFRMYAVVSSIERVRHSEISPLEISDLQVGGASLWEWSQGPGYPAALRRALERLHAGRSVARPGDAILTRVAGFDSVFVTG